MINTAQIGKLLRPGLQKVFDVVYLGMKAHPLYIEPEWRKKYALELALAKLDRSLRNKNAPTP